MIILSWNVRGAAKKTLVPHRKDLVNRHQPHILIMLETKLEPERAATTIPHCRVCSVIVLFNMGQVSPVGSGFFGMHNVCHLTLLNVRTNIYHLVSPFLADRLHLSS